MKRALIVVIFGIVLSQLLVCSYLQDWHFKEISLITGIGYGLVSIWVFILSVDHTRKELFEKCQTAMLAGALGILIGVFHGLYLSSQKEQCESRPDTQIQNYNPRSIELNNKAVHIQMYSSSPKTGELHTALQLLDSATSLDNTYYLGYQNKLNVLVDLELYERSLNVIDTLTSLMEIDYFCNIQKGLVLKKMKEDSTANECFNIAIAQIEKSMDDSPEDVNLKILYLEALLASGKEDLALQEFESLKAKYFYNEYVKKWQFNSKDSFETFF